MTEQEEFEFRLRLERERKPRAPMPRDVDWRVELEKQANSEMGMGERLFKSMGAGFADIPLALKQIFNTDPERAKQLQAEAARKREMDKDLADKTNLGILPDKVYGMGVPTLGSAAQTYGKTVPSMAIPPARVAGLVGFGTNVLTGAALGALEPTVEGESRAMNMVTSGAMSGVLPMAMSAIKGGVNAVTGRGARQRAASDIAKELTPEGGDQAAVLRQTVDRLKGAQANMNGIPLSTAAALRDAELARLEAGSRARSGANWYDFDQNQARAVADQFMRATSSADDLPARRALRQANIETNKAQAFSSINTGAFGQDLGRLRSNLDIAMQSPEASNPAVRNMLREVAAEIDRVGPDFSPQHLATIRANLSGKYNPISPNAYAAAPRDSFATRSVLQEVDDILNRATNNRWSNVVSGYARDSRGVDAAKAAGRARQTFYDPATGRVLGVAADPAGDIPKITEAGLGRAMNAARGPDKSLLLSNEANQRLESILEALRAQGIVQGVKRSATAGGGSNTASDTIAAKAAGAAADALLPSGGITSTAANATINALRNFANTRKDRALAEALQNPQQMIDLLEAKIKANAPLSDAEKYLYSTLRQANLMAATSN